MTFMGSFQIEQFYGSIYVAGGHGYSLQRSHGCCRYLTVPAVHPQWHIHLNVPNYQESLNANLWLLSSLRPYWFVS